MEYKGHADIFSWKANESRLEITVFFKPISVKQVFTRLFYAPSYGAGRWTWYRCAIDESYSDRSPLRTYEGGDETGLPDVLDFLVLSHDQLGSIAKLYGYDINDGKVKEQLNRVLESSAS